MKLDKNLALTALILFIEGLVSLSYQMLYIRQISPIVGSSVDVISWIIGIFLIALAIGYKKGGEFKGNHNNKIIFNIFLAAVIASADLSYVFVDLYFDNFGILVGYYSAMIIYCLIIVAPATYLLGQTLPLMTNRRIGESVSEISGNILFLSTIGSFLGAILTTNVFLKYFGVSITLFIVSFLLVSVYFLFPKNKENNFIVIINTIILIVICTTNIFYEKKEFVKTNQYANYKVEQFTFKGREEIAKAFRSNNSYSSVLLKESAKNIDFKTMGYIKEITDFLFSKKSLKNQNVLVIGAGGFVLSYGILNNNFTFVDIDPQIQKIAEDNFLKKEINGKFISMDGRAYINVNKIKYDVIVSDAYSSSKSIPENLTSIQYFAKLKESLKDNGWAVINVIQSNDFHDEYSRNIKSTIEQIFPYCVTNVSDSVNEFTNVIYYCNNRKELKTIYSDNLNNSNSDYYKNNKNKRDDI